MVVERELEVSDEWKICGQRRNWKKSLLNLESRSVFDKPISLYKSVLTISHS
jgi:hypothetical protein